MKATTSKGRTALHWATVTLAFFLALGAVVCFRLFPELRWRPHVPPAFQLASSMVLAELPIALRFDFPIGNENGASLTTPRHSPIIVISATI